MILVGHHRVFWCTQTSDNSFFDKEMAPGSIRGRSRLKHNIQAGFVERETGWRCFCVLGEVHTYTNHGKLYNILKPNSWRFVLDVFPFQRGDFHAIFFLWCIVVYLVRLLASDRGKSKAIGLASSISQWGFSYHDGHDDAASVIAVMMMTLCICPRQFLVVVLISWCYSTFPLCSFKRTSPRLCLQLRL